MDEADTSDITAFLTSVYNNTSPTLNLADSLQSVPPSAVVDLDHFISASLTAAAHKDGTKDADGKQLIDPLTLNEIASIHIYTQAWPEQHSSHALFQKLNYALRDGELVDVKIWQEYIRLLIRALTKLMLTEELVTAVEKQAMQDEKSSTPTCLAKHVFQHLTQRTLFRGVNRGLREYYDVNKEFQWWAFSSATDSESLHENYFGNAGDRTLFTMDCRSGVKVMHISAAPAESEILLFSGIRFIVRNCMVVPTNTQSSMSLLPLQEQYSDVWVVGKLVEHIVNGYVTARRANLLIDYEKSCRLLKSQPHEGLAGLRLAANQGCLKALNHIGKLHETDQRSRDFAKAIDCYRVAASRFDAEGFCNLAQMHEFGRGVDQNFHEAARFYSEAAKRRHPVALNNLAVLYMNGTGVGRDYVLAASYLNSSVKLGNRLALFNLGTLFHRGLGVQESIRNAIELYRRAAMQGVAKAQYELGICYLRGEGEAKDIDQAKMWLQSAANQNFPKAQRALVTLINDESQHSPSSVQPINPEILVNQAIAVPLS
jgi:TPR repeat protein